MLLMRIFLILIFLVLPLNSFAEDKFLILAKVDKKVISTLDVQQRIKLLTTGDENAKKQKNFAKNLAPQVLADLIRERIQLEYTKENGIEVSEKEMRNGFESIAQKNGMKVSEFEAFIKKNKLSKKAIEEKLEAQIAWNKLVGAKFGREIKVSEKEINEQKEEIDGKIQQVKQSAKEVYLSEIVIPFEKATKKDVLTKANQIVKDYKAGKKQFSELAIENSASKSKEVGGALGWVNIGQMKEGMRKKIDSAKPGSIVGPFQDDKRYIILKVGNERDLSKADKKALDKKLPNISKEQISNAIFNKKLEEEGMRFLNKIYKETYIEILEDNLKNASFSI